jgi:hypothetical protein
MSVVSSTNFMSFMVERRFVLEGFSNPEALLKLKVSLKPLAQSSDSRG